MVNRNFIQELLEKVKIEEVVGSYVSLRSSGSSMRGLCPFHTEKKPSFYVIPSKGFFYCFGCKKGGNAIKFLQEIEGKEFFDVVRQLAEKEGMEIPDTKQLGEFEKQRRAEQLRRKKHLEFLKKTALRYKEILFSSPDGAPGRQYLKERGISKQTALNFNIGYAPLRGAGLKQLITSSRATMQDAIDTGLMKYGQGGEGYEIFKGRVIFPITVPGGNVVGFSGRILPEYEQEETVKYLNTPETRYFRKGDLLFGLHQALSPIKRTSEAIVVEGNFDLLSMHMYGFTNVVAPLGSALTSRQIDRLRKLECKLVLLFDGDEAGIKAVMHTTEIINEMNIAADVVMLPAGEDPHSFLHKNGKSAMEELIGKRKELLHFFIDMSSAQAGRSEIEKIKKLRKTWEVLRKNPDQLVRIEILKKLSEKFGIAENHIRRALGISRRQTRQIREMESAPRKTGGEKNIKKEYEMILGAMVDYPEITDEIYDDAQQVVSDPAIKELIFSIDQIVKQSGKLEMDELLTRQIDEALKEWVIRRNIEKPFPDRKTAWKAAEDSIAKLKRKNIEKQKEIKRKLLEQAFKTGNMEEAKKLQKEITDLIRQTKEIHF